MKTSVNRLVLVIMIATTTATSCQKEDPISVVSPVTKTAARGSDDPAQPTGKTVPLADLPELAAAIDGTAELNEILAKGGDLARASVVLYGDPDKFVVVIDSSTGEGASSGWTLEVYSGEVTKAVGFTIAGSESYFERMGSKRLFAVPDQQFAGTISFCDLAGDPIGVLEVGDDGTCKPVWVRHGGYGNWVGCFEGYSSTWWGIIGYVLVPEATLLAIAVGCL